MCRFSGEHLRSILNRTQKKPFRVKSAERLFMLYTSISEKFAIDSGDALFHIFVFYRDDYVEL